MSRRVWAILGASSPIARAFAREAAATGASLVLAGRDIADMERTALDLRVRGAASVAVVPWDAGDRPTQKALVSALDVPANDVLNLFVAVGSMPAQADIEARPELIDEVVASNYAATAFTILCLLPALERRRAGSVVVLGSVAGDRGRASNFVYGSAKAAMATFLQGLRARLEPAGVKVVSVKLGFVDTGMTWGLLKGGPLVSTPESLGRRVFAFAAAGKAGEIYHSSLWFWIMAIIRNLPYAIFRRLPI